MTDNSKTVLKFMQATSGPLTNREISAGTGLKTVAGSTTSYVKKGWATRTTEATKDEKGKDVEVIRFELTDEGRAVDADAQ